MPITESAITLNFSDKNFFRFQDCQGYRDLENIKEMDVCWYDQANDILYIIELKDWGNHNLNEEANPNFSAEEIKEMKEKISTHRINDLLKKSIDSVSMFVSILLKKPYSTKIQACSPFAITQNTQIKLLTIVNWSSLDLTYIDNVNSAYKTKFKPYAKLYDIKTFLVITKKQALEMFDWVL